MFSFEMNLTPYTDHLIPPLNGHLDHLRGCALGIRNLHNYIHRSLLETRGFRPRPQLVHAGPLDEWRAQDGSFASSAPAPRNSPASHACR